MSTIFHCLNIPNGNPQEVFHVIINTRKVAKMKKTFLIQSGAILCNAKKTVRPPSNVVSPRSSPSSNSSPVLSRYSSIFNSPRYETFPSLTNESVLSMICEKVWLGSEGQPPDSGTNNVFIQERSWRDFQTTVC